MSRSEDLPAHSDDMLLRVVEHLALLLVGSGLPRMSARVLAYVLAEGRDRYTARDLAEGLRVSPAAVSGAVQILLRRGFLAKDREPGLRADLYRLHDQDVWAATMLHQQPLLERYEDVLRDGVAALEPGRPSRRLAETVEYVRFLQEWLPRTVDAWKDRRRRLHLEPVSRVGSGS